MKVIVEKKKIVGTLSTLVGRYSLLNLYPNRQAPNVTLREAGAVSFYGIDDNGFGCNIIVRGDFVVIPASVDVETDVNYVLTEEEEAVIGISVPDERLSLVE